jgi:hypothetical protein
MISLYERGPIARASLSFAGSPSRYSVGIPRTLYTVGLDESLAQTYIEADSCDSQSGVVHIGHDRAGLSTS